MINPSSVRGIARKKADPFNVIILLIMIFNSGGITIINHYFLTIATLLLFVFYFQVKKQIPLRFILYSTTLFLLLLLINYIITDWGRSPKDYIVYYSYFVSASILVGIYRAKEANFILDLTLALKLFMGHALIAFFSQFMIKDFLQPFQENKQTFYYLFYYPARNTIPILMRNQGLFWEPGVLQIFMNILFFICCFVYKSTRTALLAFFVILTTGSTTGYMLLAIQLVYFFLISLKRTYLALPSAIVLLSLVGPLMLINFYDKFSGENSKSASVRAFDVAVGLRLLSEHPITGVGLNQEKYKSIIYLFGKNIRRNYGISEDELQDKGTTNSILLLLTAFGVPMFFCYIYIFFKQQLITKKKNMLFLIIVISGVCEPILHTVFFSLFLVSGLAQLIDQFKKK